MKRIAQLVGLRPEKREEYLRLHAAVWPGVEARLSASNISNYSIFLFGDQLMSYFEYLGDDFEAYMALIAADPETREWWSHTDPCQEPLPGTPEGEIWATADEVWHLA